MEAIKQIRKVRNGRIKLDELSQFENQDVEVIIFPVEGYANHSLKGSRVLNEFKGIVKSKFTDTSENVDELVYHE